MTAGQLVDFCIDSVNAEREPEQKAARPRKASQADIDAFFGKRGKAVNG